MPNSAFITREFMILDDASDSGSTSPRRSAELAPSQGQQQAAAWPVPPGPAQHKQMVPHDWVQRSLEAQPFHRDPSQPAHVPVYQYSSPPDGNGGCAR